MSAARVGVFGGTFDPPHLGHVAVAAAAFDALDLTEVWITPAVPYHKGAAHCSTGDRVAMCAATVASVPFPASVCTVDVDRGSPTYTVDTLTELTAAHPAVELVFIAGSDVISSMHTWGPSAQRCLELATFAAAHRPGFPPPVLRPLWWARSCTSTRLGCRRSPRRRCVPARPAAATSPGWSVQLSLR